MTSDTFDLEFFGRRYDLKKSRMSNYREVGVQKKVNFCKWPQMKMSLAPMRKALNQLILIYYLQVMGFILRSYRVPTIFVKLQKILLTGHMAISKCATHVRTSMWPTSTAAASTKHIGITYRCGKWILGFLRGFDQNSLAKRHTRRRNLRDSLDFIQWCYKWPRSSVLFILSGFTFSLASRRGAGDF